MCMSSILYIIFAICNNFMCGRRLAFHKIIYILYVFKEYPNLIGSKLSMSLSILMCNFLFIYSKVKMYNGFSSKLICALLSQGAGEGEEGIAPLYRYSSIVLVCVCIYIYIYIYIDRYTYNFQHIIALSFQKKD